MPADAGRGAFQREKPPSILSPDQHHGPCEDGWGPCVDQERSTQCWSVHLCLIFSV